MRNGFVWTRWWLSLFRARKHSCFVRCLWSPWGTLELITFKHISSPQFEAIQCEKWSSDASIFIFCSRRSKCVVLLAMIVLSSIANTPWLHSQLVSVKRIEKAIGTSFKADMDEWNLVQLSNSNFCLQTLYWNLSYHQTDFRVRHLYKSLSEHSNRHLHSGYSSRRRFVHCFPIFRFLHLQICRLTLFINVKELVALVLMLQRLLWSMLVLLWAILLFLAPLDMLTRLLSWVRYSSPLINSIFFLCPY